MTSSPLTTVPASSHIAARRDVIIASLDAGETAICVTGENDRDLAALGDAIVEAAGDRAFVVRIAKPAADRGAILLQLLRDLGLAATQADAGERPDVDAVTAALTRFLRSLPPLGAHAVIIINDAHVGSRALYESLRDLGKAVNGESKPLRLILAGPPALGVRLDESPLRDFARGAWTVSTLADSTATSAGGTSARVAAVAALVLLVAGGIWWWQQQTPTTNATPAANTTAVPPATDRGNATSPAPEGTTAPTVSPPTSTSAAVPTAAATAAAPGTAYRLTVASFRTAGRAQQIAEELRARDLEVATRVDATATWHQLIAGPFTSVDAARQAQERFAAAGFPDTRISPVAPIR